MGGFFMPLTPEGKPEKQQPGQEAGLLQKPRKAMLPTGGDLMENTTQTNHLPTCELKHLAMEGNVLATCENAY